MENEKGESVLVRRRFLPPQRLILLGGGHISQPLCKMAVEVEFDVAVVDDRPSFANSLRFPSASRVICDSFPKAIKELQITSFDYVAVITRGHKNDAECLRELLVGNMPFYLGMIGSKRRVTGLLELLAEEGLDKELLEQIH